MEFHSCAIALMAGHPSRSPENSAWVDYILSMRVTMFCGCNCVLFRRRS